MLSVPTKVVEASGKVKLLVVPVVIPEDTNFATFVVSVPSSIDKLAALIANTEVSSKVLLLSVWVTAVPTKVVEASGKLKVLVVPVVMPEEENLATFVESDTFLINNNESVALILVDVSKVLFVKV